MKKFAYFSDVLFAFLVSGIFSLTLFRYLGVALPLALFLAALCGGLTALALAAIWGAKRKNLSLKKSDETQKNKLLVHLALLSDEEKTNYFQSLLSTGEPLGRFGRLRIFSPTEFYFLQFRFRPLGADEIPALARLKTGKKKILLCSQIEEAALDLCRRLDIQVKTGEWVYEKAKERSALPERFLGEEEAAPKRKRRFKLWFSRKNAKRFLVSGSLLLLLSRLSPYFYYYLLFGVLLLGVAVFVRVFGDSEVG